MEIFRGLVVGVLCRGLFRRFVPSGIVGGGAGRSLQLVSLQIVGFGGAGRPGT